jgi:hypothetical protein
MPHFRDAATQLLYHALVEERVGYSGVELDATPPVSSSLK